MQKCPNKCARFPQGLTPTAAKEVVQSVWNTFHRSNFTMPRIKAGALCGCGNAEVSAAYGLQERFCIPEGEESRCPSSWVWGAREPGQFCFTEGNCQCYRGRDRENLLIYEKGARERLISGKTYAFAGTSVHCHCVESEDIALSTRGKAGPPRHIYQQTHRSLQTPETCTVSSKTDPILLLRNWKTYNQPQGDNVTVAGFVSSYFKTVIQMSFCGETCF